MHMYVQGNREERVEEVYVSPSPSILLSPFPSQNAFDQWLRLFWLTISHCFAPKWNLSRIFSVSAQWKDLYSHTPHPSLFCFMVLPTLRIDSCGPCSFGSATGHLWLFLLSLGHRDTFLQGPHAAGHAKDYGAALFSPLSKHAQRYHRANQIVLQHRPIQRPHQKPESSTSSVRLLHQPSHPAVPHFLLPPSYV